MDDLKESRQHGAASLTKNHELSAAPSGYQKTSKKSSSRGATLIYLISFLDLFAVSMLTPLIRQQSLNMGASYTMAGLIGSIYGVFQMISGPLVGDWSDRSGRNRVLLISTLVTAIGYFVFSMSSSFAVLLVSRVICGSFKHTQTLCKAYLADLRSAEERAVPKSSEKPAKHSVDNFGHFMTVSTCGFVLGPLVGGVLAEYENGFQIVAVLTGTTFLAIAFMIKTLLPQVVMHEKERNKMSKHVKMSTGRIVQRYWDIFLLQALMSLSVLVVRTNYVQYVQENFGLSFKWAGYLTSYQALTSVIGSACVSSPVKKYYQDDYYKLMFHSTILTGLGLLATISTTSFPLYILSLTAINFATPFGRMAHMVQLTDRSQDTRHHGALMGTSQSVASLCRLSSSFIAGIAQDYSKHGPEAVSVMCTVLAILQVFTMYR